MDELWHDLVSFRADIAARKKLLVALPYVPAFGCPRCGITSYNKNDIREGYCGRCHDWTRGYVPSALELEVHTESWAGWEE